jgi:hypothetical protein
MTHYAVGQNSSHLDGTQYAAPIYVAESGHYNPDEFNVWKRFEKLEDAQAYLHALPLQRKSCIWHIQNDINSRDGVLDFVNGVLISPLGIGGYGVKEGKVVEETTYGEYLQRQ